MSTITSKIDTRDAYRRLGPVSGEHLGDDAVTFPGVRTMEDDKSFAEAMLFDANLQEFAHRVGIICGLEAGGKITREQAYRQIRDIWKQLKRSKKNLNIGNDPKRAD